jgi:hypothetical protein
VELIGIEQIENQMAILQLVQKVMQMIMDLIYIMKNMVMIVAILEILVSLADTDLQIISVLQCHMKQKIHDLVYITVLIRRLQRKMLLIFLKLVYIPIL